MSSLLYNPSHRWLALLVHKTCDKICMYKHASILLFIVNRYQLAEGIGLACWNTTSFVLLIILFPCDCFSVSSNPQLNLLSTIFDTNTPRVCKSIGGIMFVWLASIQKLSCVRNEPKLCRLQVYSHEHRMCKQLVCIVRRWNNLWSWRT